MKRVNLGLVFLGIMIVVALLSSCSATRTAGCPDTQGFVGYR
jgi:hypothetical protein